LFSVIGFAIFKFIQVSNGQQIFADDHSVFAYRLEQLAEIFPRIPFFNPLWNGGLDARDSFATGALGLFALSLPLIYLIPVEHFYNYLLLWILFIQLPFGVFLSAKLLKFENRAAVISALLIIASSLHWYRWALKYGTMGFVNGASLITLTVVTASLLFSERKSSWLVKLLFLLSFSICIFWPFYLIALAPILIYAFIKFVLSFYDLKSNAWYIKRFLFNVLILSFIHLPWIIIFISSSGVFSVFKANTPQATFAASSIDPASEDYDEQLALKAEKDAKKRKFKEQTSQISSEKSISIIRNIFMSSNPLLLFFGIAGTLYLATFLKRIWILQLTWLFILGAILVPLKPQFELDRMLILFLLLLALPAGFLVDKMLSCFENNRKLVPNLLVGLILGFLFTGPFVIFSVVSNRSVEQFQFADSMVNDFVKFLKSYEPQGRILFSGCIIHEFQGGHLAPLAYYTKHPFVASSHAHTLWWYKDVVPAEFLLKQDAGKEEFFNLYNASDIFAHEKRWKKYFRDRPDKYELVWEGHGFELFKRKNYQSSYFIEGAGQVIKHSADRVRMQITSDSAIVKFKYNAALEAGQCKVEPYSVYEDVDFVKLSNCGKEPFNLMALPAYEQIFLKNRKPIV
jgi:hypothetical protein